MSENYNVGNLINLLVNENIFIKDISMDEISLNQIFLEKLS